MSGLRWTIARFRSVLRPEREPTPLAGNAMVVVDSSQGG